MTHKTKHLVRIWNDEDHHDADDADNHGVLETIEVPQDCDYSLFIAGVQQTIHRINHYCKRMSITLKHDVIPLREYTVTGEVLEWNEYNVNVWATCQAEADAKAIGEGLVTFNHNDVTYGSSNYESDEPTIDRLIGHLPTNRSL